MRRRDVLFLTFLALAILVLSLSKDSLHAAGLGTLKVTVRYAGKDVVDERHKVFVLLMDANPFASSALVDSTEQRIPPAAEAGVAHVLAVQGAVSKEAALTFSNVPASPVYVIALFDKNGEYNGHVGSFSQGNPMGLFGDPPDKLTPIKIGRKTPAQITIEFDDSRTTP